MNKNEHNHDIDQVGGIGILIFAAGIGLLVGGAVAGHVGYLSHAVILAAWGASLAAVSTRKG